MSGIAMSGMALAVIAAAAGCSLLQAPDDLAEWREVPLPPDPGLTEAARSDLTCQTRGVGLLATPPPPLRLPLQVILQDRRTPRTAGFVVATDGYVGTCLISPGGEGQGHLRETLLNATQQAIVIDGSGGGRLGAASGTYFWGRADARIDSVHIDLVRELHAFDDDDRTVIATLGGGYWFAWWPGGATAAVVTGLDAQGEAVVTLKQFDDGWDVQ